MTFEHIGHRATVSMMTGTMTIIFSDDTKQTIVRRSYSYTEFLDKFLDIVNNWDTE
jgi:hypothetical protein